MTEAGLVYKWKSTNNTICSVILIMPIYLYRGYGRVSSPLPGNCLRSLPGNVTANHREFSALSPDQAQEKKSGLKWGKGEKGPGVFPAQRVQAQRAGLFVEVPASNVVNYYCWKITTSNEKRFWTSVFKGDALDGTYCLRQQGASPAKGGQVHGPVFFHAWRTSGERAPLPMVAERPKASSSGV